MVLRNLCRVDTNDQWLERAIPIPVAARHMGAHVPALGVVCTRASSDLKVEDTYAFFAFIAFLGAASSFAAFFMLSWRGENFQGCKRHSRQASLIRINMQVECHRGHDDQSRHGKAHIMIAHTAPFVLRRG